MGRSYELYNLQTHYINEDKTLETGGDNFETFKNSRGAHEREKMSVLTQLSSRSVNIH